MQVPQPPRQPPALTAFAVQPSLQPQPSTLLGIPLTGRVDTQFDAGYFVTIQAGSQEFKGGRDLNSHCHMTKIPMHARDGRTWPQPTSCCERDLHISRIV